MFGENSPKLPRVLDFATRQLRGVLSALNGGTGLASPGTAGNVLTSTGNGWASSPLNQGFSLISQQTINSSTAAVSVTAGIDNTYSHYIWEISNLVSVTSGVNAYLTLQQGGVFVGGTSYLSSGIKCTNGPAIAAIGDAGTAHFDITGGVGGIGNSGGQGPSALIFEFWNPANVAALGAIFKSFQSTAAGGPAFTESGGYLNVTPAATTGIKLVLSSGNIATCQANLYGMK